MAKNLHRFLAIFAAVALALGATACGNNNKNKVKLNPLAVPTEALGPNTGNILKDKPKGLPGDKENAVYTNETLRGHDDGGGN
jgi:hypothetical protein